jgi:peptidyl-prolyl cis-trans isomerase A (cyclophilin A)
VNALLLDPKRATAQAPDKVTVRLDTTKGPIFVDLDRTLAPRGVDRFFNLVTMGFYTDVAFFRVVKGFVAQGGLHGDPAVCRAWRDARIADDPVKAQNVEGTVTFATSGPNARTTQFFINLKDNRRLDAMGFAPIGRVRDLAPVLALFDGYGEAPPAGRGPQQGRIQREGNVYLRAEHPELDYIERATIEG